MMDLGDAIRHLRQARRLTLAQLAKRCAIDQATLSRIETGKMAGTIDSHRGIARALGLRLSELYAALDDDAKVRQAVSIQAQPAAGDVTTYAPGHTSAQVLTTQILQKKMLPALLSLPPRGHTAVESFPLGTERFLYILDGSVTVKVRKEPHPLTARQTIYLDAHLPHQMFNAAARPARVLSVLTPPVV